MNQITRFHPSSVIETFKTARNFADRLNYAIKNALSMPETEAREKFSELDALWESGSGWRLDLDINAEAASAEEIARVLALMAEIYSPASMGPAYSSELLKLVVDKQPSHLALEVARRRIISTHDSMIAPPVPTVLGAVIAAKDEVVEIFDTVTRTKEHIAGKIAQFEKRAEIHRRVVEHQIAEIHDRYKRGKGLRPGDYPEDVVKQANERWSEKYDR
jgi:hypothetical protein